MNCSTPKQANEEHSTGLATLQFARQHFPDNIENVADLHGVRLVLNGIYAVDKASVFLFGALAANNSVGMHRSLILHTSDGGNTWQESAIASETNQSFYLLAFVDEGCGWALAAYDVEDFTFGALYRSSDYGQTWGKPIAIGEWGFHVWGIRFFDKDNGEITFDKFTASPTDRVGVITTTDGGQTWVETLSIPALNHDRGQQLIEQFAMPAGGNYGSYWTDWNSSDSIRRAMGHDDSDWHFYYNEPSREYVVLWRENSTSSWEVASTLSAYFDYKNGQVSSIDAAK